MRRPAAAPKTAERPSPRRREIGETEDRAPRELPEEPLDGLLGAHDRCELSSAPLSAHVVRGRVARPDDREDEEHRLPAVGPETHHRARAERDVERREDGRRGRRQEHRLARRREHDERRQREERDAREDDEHEQRGQIGRRDEREKEADARGFRHDPSRGLDEPVELEERQRRRRGHEQSPGPERSRHEHREDRGDEDRGRDLPLESHRDAAAGCAAGAATSSRPSSASETPPYRRSRFWNSASASRKCPARKSGQSTGVTWISAYAICQSR